LVIGEHFRQAEFSFRHRKTPPMVDETSSRRKSLHAPKRIQISKRRRAKRLALTQFKISSGFRSIPSFKLLLSE
jgi:hypothetical protein